uniref:Uncharacterized protein n=1 Tax=Mandrillus leucophaeus TaxID=9568 RepID=A0A2K5YAC0_MANLE
GGRRGSGGSRAAPQRGSCASANAQKQLRQTAATYMLTARGGSRSAERKGDLQRTFRQVGQTMPMVPPDLTMNAASVE